jgi:hypothetical protein
VLLMPIRNTFQTQLSCPNWTYRMSSTPSGSDITGIPDGLWQAPYPRRRQPLPTKLSLSSGN